MRIRLEHLIPGRRCPLRSRRAFTLLNLLVTMGLFLLVITGVISSHILGLRMMESGQIKLAASDEVPMMLNRITTDIQGAKQLQVGQGDRYGFVGARVNVPQQGNALQIYSTGGTNQFVRYYWDAADQTLKRVSDSRLLEVMAECVTNSTIFAMENFAGAVLTNQDTHHVIGVSMEFSGLKNSGIKFGPGHAYRSYRFQTKIASRVME